MNFMPHDDIISICKDFYSAEDIDRSKTLMYEKYNCPGQGKIHRGVQKSLNDLKEILSFMSQRPSPSCTFVIAKCTQAPAVVMDYIDAASLSMQVTNLRGNVTMNKSRVDNLERSTSSQINKLLNRIEKLENAAKHPAASDQNHTTAGKETRNNQGRGHNNTSKTPSQVTSTGILPTSDDNISNKTNTTKKNELSYRDVLRPEYDDSISTDSEGEGETWRLQGRPSKVGSQRPNNATAPARRNSRPQRRGPPPVIGKRPTGSGGGGGGVRAARQLRDVHLFVSRLEPDVDVGVLRAQVQEITGSAAENVICELLPQKHSSYRSCKITINSLEKNKIQDLYNADNWENDLLVKRWW